MSKTLLKLPGVISKVSLQKTFIWNAVKAGTFPQPIKIGTATLWIESEIDAWIDERIAESRGVE